MSSKSAPQECQIRVSSKSVLPARSAIVSSKGVLQQCHLSVSSQGVPQVGSLETVTIISINLVSQHTCRHSGSWASSCSFFFFLCSILYCRWLLLHTTHTCYVTECSDASLCMTCFPQYFADIPTMQESNGHNGIAF